jgi:large subunit ribosomal protein L7/L12
MDIEALANQLGKLTLLEASQLAKLLEEKWGVSAKSVAPTITHTPAIDEEAPQTEFTVELISIGEKKIEVVKEVRAITNLGLKESKDFVENVPKIIREGVDKETADKLKDRLEKVGAKVEVR